MKQQELSFIVGGNAKWYSLFGRQFGGFLQNLPLPYDPAVVLLGIYPKHLKNCIYAKICTWLFIAALFVIAQTWKQSICPSVGKWINKLRYIQKTGLLGTEKK